MSTKDKGPLKLPKIPKQEITPQLRVVAGILAPILRLIMNVKTIGQENVPKSGPYILVSNHMSMVDPLAVAYSVYIHLKRAPHYMAKEGLFRVPIFGWLITKLGQIPVYRSGRSNEETLKAAKNFLDAGHTLQIFPEGTLTRDPNMWPMRGRSGAIRLAIETGVPVIPVAHWGDQKIMGNYESVLKPNPFQVVNVLIGKEIPLDKYRNIQLTPELLKEASNLVMTEITKLVAQLRQEEPPKELWDPAVAGQPVVGNFRKKK